MEENKINQTRCLCLLSQLLRIPLTSCTDCVWSPSSSYSPQIIYFLLLSMIVPEENNSAEGF